MKRCYLDKRTRTIADLSQSPNGAWEIHRINVPIAARGKLVGSRMLDKICAEADAEQATLWLLPVATGGLTHSALVAWYSKRGFEWMGKKECSPLVRKPKRVNL